MIDFKNKKVAILGFGVEGLSTLKFLIKHGADVTVCDQNKDIKISGYKDIKRRLGKDYLKNLSDFDIIVRSPGIKRDLSQILEAEKKGSVMTSHTKIFFDLCPCKIIGVTGTKGKGTTSTLIYRMLKEEGFDLPARLVFDSSKWAGRQDAYLGGNIGYPPLDFLDKLTPQSRVVLELSSFQLQDLKKSPHIAVILMITREHLDYHKDVEEYIQAKRNILKFQSASDFAVINKDYPASRESDIHTEGKVFEISREVEVGQGCFAKKGEIILKMADNKEKIINAKDVLLPGEHNLENICAAVMAATLAGVSNKSIVKVLKTFKGLEHRLELVSEIYGVKYYDDSFSTTPETAIAAIKAFENPEILILGGSSKNSDFKELGIVISRAKNIKAIIGIGKEWKRIKEQITSDLDITIVEGLKTMKEIVVRVALEAEAGDVVLLSPACASFDMFKNYKERGNQFKEEVLKLNHKSQIPNRK